MTSGGSWIQTFTGEKAYVRNPWATRIVLADIAHALSNICRYNGHCEPFYSVAQHSVHVSYLVPPELAAAGLLHDAAEAYTGDIPKPWKQELPDFRALSAMWESAIMIRFRVNISTLAVKHADDTALATEKRDLMVHNTPWVEWAHGAPEVDPDPFGIIPLTPKEAEADFLGRARELGIT